MGGIDKLDMMCSLYKPTLRSKRWYIYLWLHSLTIFVINVTVIKGIHNGLTHKRKPCLYVHFKQMLQAVWLVQKTH